jgi:metal-responsive CopG/Arc/MetJ family transcriptional regulator
MKVKTSITLSEELLKELDEVSAEYKNRSDVIEQALQSFLQNRVHQMREARDLKILNEKAKSLNEEAEDVLAYQVDL